MNWKEFFKPTILKVLSAIVLQIIQFIGLAGCFVGGDFLCNFNPFVLTFEFVGIASFVVSPVITYIVVCWIARIFKK